MIVPVDSASAGERVLRLLSPGQPETLDPHMRHWLGERMIDSILLEGLTREDADGNPVAELTGRQDRIVGVADQFRRMGLYPRGAFVASDLAGHYLPYERPDVLRAVNLDWLDRCGVT